MSKIRRIPFLSIFFLFCLILLNGIGATLPIPNLTFINEHYQFPLIGLVEAIFVLISTLLLFFWGYFVDKIDRKSILWIANIIWAIPSLIIFLFPESLLIQTTRRNNGGWLFVWFLRVRRTGIEPELLGLKRSLRMQ